MKNYTLDELKEHWKGYQTTKVMRVLKNGVWEIVPLSNRSASRIEGTKAETVTINKVKTFPQYLEEL